MIDALLACKIMVFFDMLAVSLILPLIPAYFKANGCDTAYYGLVTSLYSGSPLLGGVFMGICSDIFSKKYILIISFIGSALSYTLIGTTRSLEVMLFSRVLVGLVKQTYSMTSQIVSENVGREERSEELARISAAMTLAFIVGPSLGGVIYEYFHPLAPTVIAVSLFAINISIALVSLPDNDKDIVTEIASTVQTGDISTEKKEKPKALGNTFFTFWSMGSEFDVAKVILVFRVLVAFLERSMSSRQILNYYETRFAMDTSHVGYVMSTASLISFVTNSILVGRLRRFAGGDYTLIFCAIIVMTIASVCESYFDSAFMYVLTCLVPLTVGRCALEASLEGIFSLTVPNSHLGKARSVLSLAMSGVGLLAPAYGTWAFLQLSEFHESSDTDADSDSQKADLRYQLKGFLAASHYLILLLVMQLVFYNSNMHYIVGTSAGKKKKDI
jgi:MFS family permease